MDNHNQSTVPTTVCKNRYRPGPDGQLPPGLEGKIKRSSDAWMKRENAGTNPPAELSHGELIPPGYLSGICPRCGHPPDVAILSNGNKTRDVGNNDQFAPPCSHTICSMCHFVPEGLKGMPCIFRRRPTISILDALHPDMYLSNEPVSAQNLSLLERHLTPDFFQGKNPVATVWQDLRIVVEQRKAYLHRDGDPHRRKEFELLRMLDRHDPRLCRERIIDFRSMHVDSSPDLRLFQRQAALRRNKVTVYVKKLPRVSPEELGDNPDCHICLSPYDTGEDTEPLEEPVRLPCSHVLGTSCLSKWLFKSSTCPNCRTKLLSSRYDL